jgi:predicted acylesterase/phospholipase RssA
MDESDPEPTDPESDQNLDQEISEKEPDQEPIDPEPIDQEKPHHDPHPKHLVICGGVVYGFIYYGIVHRLAEANFLNVSKLKSIHSTSIGSVLAVSIAVERDWELLHNYFLNRPWQEIVPFSINKMLQSIRSVGMFNNECIRKLMQPIFAANGLNIDTLTMAELYEYTKIDIHMYTINVNSFDTVAITYKTHPEWRVLDALYVSCCIPVAFQPYRDPVTKCYYIDGGFLINYPIYPCIQYCYREKDKLSSILGIQMNLKDGCTESLYNTIHSEDNLSFGDYIYMILNKIIWKIVKLQPNGLFTTDQDDAENSPMEICINPKKSCVDFMPLIRNRENRKEYIDIGIQEANEFLARIRK